MDIKQVAVVIVTYNRKVLLQECIEAIRSQSYKNYDIIVVNNSSTDGSKEWLEEQDDIITITQENQGGSGGFFTGIKYAVENGYPYTWVMDDDAIPTSSALEKLVQSTKIVSDFGFLCSRVFDKNGYPCNCPSIDYKKNEENGEGQWLTLIDDGMLRVKCCSFVSVFLNNKHVLKVGLPYREYFIWGDDTEYTIRLSNRTQCFLVINSLVIHKRESGKALSIFTEFSKLRVGNYFYSYRNNIHLAWKYDKKRGIYRYFLSVIDAIKLLIIGDFCKSFTVWKALFLVLFFYPKIVYPTCMYSVLSSRLR